MDIFSLFLSLFSSFGHPAAYGAPRPATRVLGRRAVADPVVPQREFLGGYFLILLPAFEILRRLEKDRFFSGSQVINICCENLDYFKKVWKTGHELADLERIWPWQMGHA